MAAGDRPADARDSAGASVRTGRRHDARSSGSPPRHNLRDRRRLLPGAPRDRCRAAGRHDRRRRRVQLLSDQESRRARRRRRGRDQRSRARRHGSGGCATAARPTGTITRRPASTRGSTSCRRRSCARGCRGSPAGPAGAARWRRGIAAAGERRGHRPAAGARPGHVYHLFVVRVRDARGDARLALQTAPGRSRHRNAGALPGCRFRGSRRWRRADPRDARPRRARATKCCRCRSILG